MAEVEERVKRILHGCAEPGVAAAADPWPAIRKRIDERISGEQRGEDRRTRVEHTGSRGPDRAFPFSPSALALAVLSVMVLAAIVYVAAGPLHGPSQQGPENKGTEPNRTMGPDGGLSDLKTKLDQTKTADGARVTLDWAYADESFVAVGLHTQSLEDTSKPEGSDPDSRTTQFEPALWEDAVGNEAELPPYVKITDASGQDFDTVGGGTRLGPERTGAEAAFDAPEGIGTGQGHHFRLEVPLTTAAGGMPGEKPEAGPLLFDFEVPVLPAPTIEVNQAVEAEGITLKRVVDSPLMPQAIVCFDPPDDEHDWMPFLRYEEGL